MDFTQLELKDFIDPLKKWWWLILISTILAGGASAFAVSQQPDIYRSQASLMIGNAIEDPNPTNSDFQTGQQLAEFYVSLGNRPSIQRDTEEAVEAQCDCNIEWPEVFVYRFNDTTVIDIIVRDTDPNLAQAVASEIANQIMSKTPTAQGEDEARREFINRQLDQYETFITETELEIELKYGELETVVSAREASLIQGEIAGLEEAVDAARKNYSELLPSAQRGATNSIRLVEPATYPWKPVDQNNLVTIATAAGIGFVLAAAAAYLLEFLDDTIKTPYQVKKLMNQPTLAGIAVIESPNKLITASKPRSPISEAFRVLRTAIQFATVDNYQQTILVTSAVSEEGRTTMAANLAIILAQAGQRVLLVDADLRKPDQHLMFKLNNKRGLTWLLLEFDENRTETELDNLVEESVQDSAIDGLHVLTSGLVPPNPSELLGSARMSLLLNRLSVLFDYVILDGAPLLAVTDSAVLSALVGGTLLTLRAGKTRKKHVKESLQTLAEVNGHLAGSVLNVLKPGSEGYASYYYYQESYEVHEDAPVEDVGYTPAGTGRLRQRLKKGDEGLATAD